MANNISLLSTVPYKLFDKWYVEFYLNQNEYSSSYDMLSLRELISPVRRIIKKNDYDGELPIVSKIVFKTGKIIFRNENKTGMDLLDVHEGDLLVSSINFHQGAIALNNIGNFVCSTHYQTFEINKKMVMPEYLVIVLRGRKFIDMVAGIKANGIKNESGYDFIGGFNIPVPSIPEQQKLMEEYRRISNQTVILSKQADEKHSSQLTSIQKTVSTYGKKAHSGEQEESLLNIIRFTSTDRWEVGYIYKEGIIDSVLESFEYPAKPIGELKKESLFGLSVKASLEQTNEMIPVLRMSNVQNGEMLYDELKYLPYECAVTADDSEKWLLRKGDFLITRTNGSKDLVGKAAVFNADEIYTYASYLIRYRFDTEIVLPEYVNILFMTPIVREQIAVMRRQGGGQYNLNSDEINSIKIPVPDIPMQRKVIQLYQDSLTELKKLKKQANDNVNNAHKFVETSLYKHDQNHPSC